MTPAGPALAAVVVAYDSAHDLPGTLASIREQMAPGDELIVVDNASRDGSGAVAREAGAVVVELARNEGFAGGCVAGAAAAGAPLLFFLNPDAPLLDGCLEALRGTASARPDWGAWQALVLLEGGERVNTSGGTAHWSGLAWADGDAAVAPPRGAPPRDVPFASGAALVVRREAWDAVGGFDPAYFMYGEDLDLSLRLRLAGWGLGVVPDARVEHAYEFAKGPYKWFYLERNRWWTVLGAYPGRLLWLALPALIALDLALLPVAAVGGWLGAKLRAQRAVLGSLRWAWRRRARVQATREVSAAEFAAALSASLDSPYLGRAAALPGAEALQAAYWRAVTRALGR